MIDRILMKKITGIFLIVGTIILAIFILFSMYKNFSALMVPQPKNAQIHQAQPNATLQPSPKQEKTQSHNPA